jgi:DNA-binding response OmpR family regulator
MALKDKYRIYLVEDDEMLAEEISRLLKKWGYEVCVAKAYNDILQEFLAIQPDVVLMDVNIPSFDGFYWCRKIRDISAVPVIYISSRDSSMDVIMGMNNGGDDYLVKPFDNAVLVAKLQAIIRRTYELSVREPHVLRYRGLTLYLDEAIAAYENKKMNLRRTN